MYSLLVLPVTQERWEGCMGGMYGREVREGCTGGMYGREARGEVREGCKGGMYGILMMDEYGSDEYGSDEYGSDVREGGTGGRYIYMYCTLRFNRGSLTISYECK